MTKQKPPQIKSTNNKRTINFEQTTAEANVSIKLVLLANTFPCILLLHRYGILYISRGCIPGGMSLLLAQCLFC